VNQTPGRRALDKKRGLLVSDASRNTCAVHHSCLQAPLHAQPEECQRRPQSPLILAPAAAPRCLHSNTTFSWPPAAPRAPAATPRVHVRRNVLQPGHAISIRAMQVSFHSVMRGASNGLGRDHEHLPCHPAPMTRSGARSGAPPSVRAGGADRKGGRRFIGQPLPPIFFLGLFLRGGSQANRSLGGAASPVRGVRAYTRCWGRSGGRPGRSCVPHGIPCRPGRTAVVLRGVPSRPGRHAAQHHRRA